VLNHRTRVLDLSQHAHDALLSPTEPGGLSLALRAAIASRVAATNQDEALTAHYRALLDAAEGAPDVLPLADPTHVPDSDADPWLRAVIGHADLLASAPQTSSKATIEALQAAGVADADIVRLTQLVGFVTYHAGLAAGLRLLAAN
jgi:uncharacterized protein YciW